MSAIKGDYKPFIRIQMDVKNLRDLLIETPFITRPEGFHEMIQGRPFWVQNRFNPPACVNANADVESVHSTSESEFYEAERFISGENFRHKAWTYQFW